VPAALGRVLELVEERVQGRGVAAIAALEMHRPVRLDARHAHVLARLEIAILDAADVIGELHSARLVCVIDQN